MQYSEGRVGRVFVVRVEDGEDFPGTIERFVSEKAIMTGTIHFLGALREGVLVTGPEKPVIPPVPQVQRFSGGWEVVGFATIYRSDEGPAIHYHASAGRGEGALTGCLREKAAVYLIVEAVITEFIGIAALRVYDEETGLKLPVLEHRS